MAYGMGELEHSAARRGGCCGAGAGRGEARRGGPGGLTARLLRVGLAAGVDRPPRAGVIRCAPHPCGAARTGRSAFSRPRVPGRRAAPRPWPRARPVPLPAGCVLRPTAGPGWRWTAYPMQESRRQGDSVLSGLVAAFAPKERGRNDRHQCDSDLYLCPYVNGSVHFSPYGCVVWVSGTILVLCGSAAEQIARLAIEHFTDSCECGEPDCLGASVLQYRQVHIGYAYVRSELREGHTAITEETIEVDADSVAFLFFARLHTTPSRSSCMRVPMRMIRAKVTSPIAVRRAR